jgi:hypothetical protein
MTRGATASSRRCTERVVSSATTCAVAAWHAYIQNLLRLAGCLEAKSRAEDLWKFRRRGWMLHVKRNKGKVKYVVVCLQVGFNPRKPMGAGCISRFRMKKAAFCPHNVCVQYDACKEDAVCSLRCTNRIFLTLGAKKNLLLLRNWVYVVPYF